jgi:cell division protein FtsW (lipid II flippase)
MRGKITLQFILLLLVITGVFYLTGYNWEYALNSTVSIITFVVLWAIVTMKAIKYFASDDVIKKIVEGSDNKQTPMETAGYMIFVSAISISTAIILVTVYLGGTPV